MSPTPEGLTALLGAWPETPLDARVLDEQEAKDHVRRLVDYQATPVGRVQAFLLVPRRARTPAPAVLAIHQDGGTRPYAHGKSEPAGVGGDPELAYGLELCWRGYVVLCPDRFGFESRGLERSPFAATFAGFRVFKEDGLELTEDLYKGAVGNRLLFGGRTTLGMELHELRRAVDLLAAEPAVDRARIGVIGHSAGGLLAALAMYLDPRIGAGCASCGTFLYRWIYGQPDFLRPINGFAGSVVPGMARWGDVDDALAGLAPRPWFEARGDASGAEEVEELTGKARARYAELGAAERFEYVAYAGGHVFRRDLRERAYGWLDRWLGA